MFKFFKRKIKLESFEVRIIINSLKVMRNKLIENNEDTEYVEEILLKYLQVQENFFVDKKNKIKDHRCNCTCNLSDKGNYAKTAG